MAAHLTKVLTVESVDSTNVELRRLHKKGQAGQGTVLIAGAQTAGRGRGENRWHSPRGGLFFSVLLTPLQAKRATDLSLLAGVAVAQTVRNLLPKAVDVGLKWPNDCLLNWKKVGGILCEVIPESKEGLCVVGVGINVNTPAAELQPFLRRPFSATSFMEECPDSLFAVDKVAEALIFKFDALYNIYLENGFKPIQQLWERNCALVGKKVEIAVSAESKIQGTCLGIDEFGALLLTAAEPGERRRIVSGELTCYWQ
ncbi:biotin--[acetyl-CoA-carboxylase] ligase [bacterium]|nr:biotin--[acetyl-CoA-carboxylase] ligase [bacterium]